MQKTIEYWQWPNVLACDAVLIAMAWQAAFATSMGLSPGWAAYAVLGLSVWLTYMADRLIDVASRPATSLLSLRHQFAKRHARMLRGIWTGVLVTNLVLAAQLSAAQLQRGTLLLLFCLLYTLLNQILSRRFFPKELCVALIYTGGVTVFLPDILPLGPLACFAWLCLLNCLIIGAKETSIDAELRVHSLAQLVAERWLGLLTTFSVLAIFWIDSPLRLPLALSFGLLGLLHRMRKRFAIENFRVLADGLLLAGPLLLLMRK